MQANEFEDQLDNAGHLPTVTADENIVQLDCNPAHVFTQSVSRASYSVLIASCQSNRMSHTLSWTSAQINITRMDRKTMKIGLVHNEEVRAMKRTTF